MRERCHECFNVDTYCTCGQDSTVAQVRDKAQSDSRTDFQKARDDIKSYAPSGPPAPLRAVDLVKYELGYDQTDALVLCPKCGVTWDYECSYGGWHDETMRLSVSVPWMEEDDWGRHL